MAMTRTDIRSRSALCGNHEVLQFLKLEAFASHSTHCVVQHLTGGIGILDFVPSKCYEESHWVLSEVDWRNKVCRRT